MAGPFYSCNAGSILADIACFEDGCTSEQEREALDVYLRILNLKAIGGTDYSANFKQLMIDAAQLKWLTLRCSQRKAIDLWMTMQNASDNGAVFDQNINAMKAGAKCYVCLGMEDLKNLQKYLACLINTRGEPD